MPEMFQHLQAVVFDWAGTTIDQGSCAPAIVLMELFSRRGIEITAAEARASMGVAKRDHIASIAASPDVSRRWAERFGGPPTNEDVDRMYEEFLPLQKETLASHSRVIRGAAEAVAQCRARGLKIGSSTGYTHDLVNAFLDSAAAAGYAPDCVLCSEDVPQGRPAPWMLFEAARQFGVYPMWRIVKVDDTPVGIEAGRNAGCWTVGISRTGNGVGLSEAELAVLTEDRRKELIAAAAETLLNAGADYVIEAVADLMPVLNDIELKLAANERPHS